MDIARDHDRFLLELASQIWKIYPGVHVGHRKVLWRRGTRVEIEPSRETQLDLDGELGGAEFIVELPMIEGS